MTLYTIEINSRSEPDPLWAFGLMGGCDGPTALLTGYKERAALLSLEGAEAWLAASTAIHHGWRAKVRVATPAQLQRQQEAAA